MTRRNCSSSLWMPLQWLLGLGTLVFLFHTVASLPYPDCPSTGTVSRSSLFSGTILPEDAPSPAPSKAHECTSQTSNARGRYSSSMAPCEFAFHTSTAEEAELIDYQTSDLCNDDNVFLVTKEYVYDWGDECVGDFRRCYSLVHHRQVLFEFLCAMDWKIPEGTTHMSVSCMEDKELVYENEQEQERAEIHERTMDRMDRVELKLVNLVLILGSCLIGIFTISRAIVRPMVNGALRLEQRQGSSTGSSYNEDSQTGSSDRGNTWIPSQHFTLDVQVHDDEHLDSIDEDDDVHSDDSEAYQRSFEMQVPADFDAVPIVAATVLPDIQ